MKLLTIAVPCYNSENYMSNCIESLLVGGEVMEIIVVNDGSTDGTGEIAEEYAAKYPDIVKVIHQENGGHGAAVNTGIEHAEGFYFKVVDSDDWVSKESLLRILEQLSAMVSDHNRIDMLISNFVYEKTGSKHKKVMHYRNVFPTGKVLTWKKIGRFRKGQYLLMHSVIYRTELLHRCGLKLPEHTFYVDNIYVYHPLPYVRTLMYLDEDFYRYFIGREDQSVNEKIMVRRVDQQLKVNYLLLNDYRLSDSDMKIEPKLRHYMKNYLEIMMVVSSILLILSDTQESLKKKKELWKHLKKVDIFTYYQMRLGILGRCMNLPGKTGREISKISYRIAQRVVGFN